jgi:lysophospholipase L1-like esterase
MKTRVLRGLVSFALVSAFVAVAGCSTGQGDAEESGGAGGTSGSGGAGGSGATGGTGMAPVGTTEDCGRCAKSADCVSGFCNGVNAELGVCTVAGALDCKLADDVSYRGLSGKAQDLAAELPEPGAPGDVVQYDADDENIAYTGRIDFSDAKAPRFSAPAVTIRASFSGTSVSVKLADEFRWGRRNYFDIVIDEEKTADDGSSLAIHLKLSPIMGQTEHQVVSGLPAGEHSVTLVKRTESSIGYSDFLGFGFDGPILEKPAPAARKIQIIGDSINCGVGDDLPAHTGTTDIEGTFCKEDSWGVPYHDAYLAFGAVTARHFDAEYQVAAVSGIGLLRTYSSNPADDLRTLPEVYDSLFLDDPESPAWDPKDFVPDAVLIALGTNDFSPGDNPPTDPREDMDVGTFVDAYIELLDKLMGDEYYPDAQFFVLGSPMLGDMYPDADDTFRTDHEAAIALVEEHYADLGNVHAVKLKKTFGKGCGRHPSASEQATTATTDLIPAVSEVMGW